MKAQHSVSVANDASFGEQWKTLGLVYQSTARIMGRVCRLKQASTFFKLFTRSWRQNYSPKVWFCVADHEMR